MTIPETASQIDELTALDARPRATSSGAVGGNAGSGSGMVQTLGLFSSTALVIGSMIGSGIFIVEADIARGTDSPALLVAAWVVTAILTLIGALSYGELAAMMPKAGGQYVYLREALGPLWGFLYGWTLFLVIQTGTIAAVAWRSASFWACSFPPISTTHWLWHIAHVPALPVGPMVLGNMEIGLNTANLTGMIIICLLAVVNLFGVKLGALIQNVFTSAKAISLAGLVVLAFTVGRNATAWAANFGDHWSLFWRNASWSSLHPIQVGIGGPIVLVNMAVIVAAVQVGSLFSSDAWNNITFTAGEVKNPKRNIPLSLVLGTGFVSTVYILASFGYMLVLPMHGDPHGTTVMARGIQYAAEDRVGTAALEEMFHSQGAWLMAAAILISTFGCANGLTLAGARVYYAMSRDGLFFKSVGKLHPKYKTPAAGLIDSGSVGGVSLFVGIVRTIARLHYFRGAGLLYPDDSGIVCSALQAAGCRGRIRRWDIRCCRRSISRMAGWICIVLLRYKPQYTWPGIVFVLLGIPVYFFWSRQSAAATTQEYQPI